MIVNFAPQDAKAPSRFGGEVLLPPWGFVIDGPRLAAFHAKRWNGRDYPEGALFTLQALGGKGLSEAAQVRVFHAFGDPKILWRGTSHQVRREGVIGIGREEGARPK